MVHAVGLRDELLDGRCGRLLHGRGTVAPSYEGQARWNEAMPTRPEKNAKNEYLLTIRLTTKQALDPEAVRRIESKVSDLLRNTIWEASGVASIEGHLWGRHGEGQL